MQQLLEVSKAAGVKRFLFASTIGVYGNQYNMLLHEDLPLNPVDPYSESKAIGESALRGANTDDFCTTALRIAMVYGLGPKVREDFLVNRLCIDAATTGRLSIMGGTQKRPQIHVDDLASLFLTLLQYDKEKICGKVFNAVESNPALSELVEVIRKLLPAIEVQLLPGRAHEDSFEMDGQLLFNQIGFRPSTPLESGMQELINYYRSVAKG